MTASSWTALIALIGSILSSFCGIFASAKLTSYRLEQLEKKVQAHNHLIERMTVVEQSVRSAHHRIDDCRAERAEWRKGSREDGME